MRMGEGELGDDQRARSAAHPNSHKIKVVKPGKARDPTRTVRIGAGPPNCRRKLQT
jgi:hypothetical protein